MSFTVVVLTMRLFLRLFLSLILLSAGISKLAHPGRFQQGIQEYQILPPTLESKMVLSRILSFGVPVLEITAGLGLITGLWLVPTALFTIGLFVVYSSAITFNLLRDRHDLSCHCGGVIGSHPISWWQVGRNSLLIFSLLFLLFTPPDVFTVASFLRSSSQLHNVLVSIFIPVALLVVVVLAAIVLLRSARAIWRF
jgi:uncharacterized membrane protein YphA (DoxX/SURF4 family)